MDYPATLEFLYQQLPIFQRVGKAAYKADLSNTYALSTFFKDPHKHFRSVHIAGTNGKGSVAHMLASVFQQAGYKTGLYTSPHLKDFRERVKINGEMISKEKVVDFVAKAKPAIEEIHPSFFELTMMMAFEHFRLEEVDIAMIETGMGGRLDSTNIITPEVSVITNIGMDHTAFLGKDEASIAGEKAGIIKQGVPIIIGRAEGDVRQVFEEKAQEQNAPIFYAQEQKTPMLRSDLKGIRQTENAKTAFVALEHVRSSFQDLSPDVVLKGLKNVVRNTGLQGRWQTLREAPKVIADIAHNEDSIRAMLENLSKEQFNELHIIFGAVNDKEVETMLSLAPKNATYYFCKADIPRGLNAEELRTKALSHGLLGSSYSSVAHALIAAERSSVADDLVLISGSAFVVAEVL